MNDSTSFTAIQLDEAQADRLRTVMQGGNTDEINACVEEIVSERAKQAAIDKMRDMFLRDVIRAALFYMHQRDGQKAHDLLCIADRALDGNFDDAVGVRLSELLNEGLLGAAKASCEGEG